MIKFIHYINESKEGKNVHLEHIEDLVFNEGVTGTRKAILFLIELRNMLSGNSKKPLNLTTKWDGAPAIFAGVDPADGKFFVAKKGLFNVDPQMFKSIESINQSTLVPELKSKFTTAFTEFSKLGIKNGVYQGDLMFTSEDLRKEKIGEEEFITFQPNTIVYAVPAVSALAKRLRAAKIGIVWHTTYTGASIPEMKASFGKSIVDKMIPSKSVWMDDATYKDVSGTATFTSDETRIFNSYLSLLGKIFKSLSPAALNRIAANPDFLIRLKTFNNSKVRQGKNITTVSPRAHMQEFISYLKQYYEKEAASKKSQAGKQATFAKLLPMLDYFVAHTEELTRIYELVIIMTKAKEMVVKKLNMAAGLSTFLRTNSGFKVTDQEGYVAIDHIGNAVKLVDRLEFSTANFSPEILKGWQR
jgi:hypothetical protein